MSGAERRTAHRYVLGDLSIEINGVRHETVNISARSVAVIARPDIDYANLRGQVRFVSGGVAELNRDIVSLIVTGLRRSMAIFDYAVNDPAWEVLLKRYDAANDTPVLEDIFG